MDTSNDEAAITLKSSRAVGSSARKQPVREGEVPETVRTTPEGEPAVGMFTVAVRVTLIDLIESVARMVVGVDAVTVTVSVSDEGESITGALVVTALPAMAAAMTPATEFARAPASRLAAPSAA